MNNNKYIIKNSTPRNWLKIAKRLGLKLDKNLLHTHYLCTLPDSFIVDGACTFFGIPMKKDYGWNDFERGIIRNILNYLNLGINIEWPIELYDSKYYKYILTNSTPKNWRKMFDRLGFKSCISENKKYISINHPANERVCCLIPVKKTKKNIDSWNRWELINLRLIFRHLGTGLEIYKINEILE
jgi:hypothetical protein